MNRSFIIGTLFGAVVVFSFSAAADYFVAALAEELQQTTVVYKEDVVDDSQIVSQPTVNDQHVEFAAPVVEALVVELDSKEEALPEEPVLLPEIADMETLDENNTKPQAVAPTTQVYDTSAPTSVILDVPFVPQAPFGDWDDPRQDYGCEETSLLMVMHWLTGEPLTKEYALEEIMAMSDWELENNGVFHDTSVADTVQLYKDYFNMDNIWQTSDVSVESIKEKLANGYAVLLPIDGRIVQNPYYTPPGPMHHMLVVIGYDDATNEFITNDPGTSRGSGLRYSYENLYDAIADYDTGHAIVRDQVTKAMIYIK